MNACLKVLATAGLVMLAAGAARAQQGKSPPAQGNPPAQGGQVKGQTPNPQAPIYGGINQTPWFGDKGVQQHLGYTAAQYNGLNKGYSEAYNNYNASVAQLGAGLTEQQRAQKMQELQANFNQSVGKSVDGVITNPLQRQRYNEMQLQYQGYSALSDSKLQDKLNLNNDQREKLAQYGFG